jgi:excisionase family DNA binding protein
MSDLRQQILASLQPQDVVALSDAVVSTLASRLAPYLTEVAAAPEPTGWLDLDGAAEHLGMPKSTLYKLTAAKTVPFHQDGPGCKLWFLRSELDEWRQHRGSRRARSGQLRAA